MTQQKTNRRRGAVLTAVGDRKLTTARWELEQVANFGDRYTNEELAVVTGLSPRTITKIFTSATIRTAEQQIPVDKQTLDRCFAAFKLELTRHDYFYPDADETALVEQMAVHTPPPQLGRDPLFDRGEAPDVSVLYGRSAELARLAQWVNIDRCRLVAILGMGGIGKTALVTKLAQQIQPDFTAIVWRSLRNAPRLNDLLPEIIQVFSQQTETVPATMEISAQISRLLHYLCEQRCLLILDNVETILPQSTADTDRYPGYTELFERIGGSNHQSCLLLTSREKPAVIVPFEGAQLFVRTFGLHGLNPDESDRLFNAKGLSASSSSRSRLCELYSGNPLALNIVATSICDLFDGEIDKFLATKVVIFNGIRQLLDRQFDRLSPAERVVMYWLAIERAWISPTDLHAQIVPPTTKSRVLETLESLSRKSLIEHSWGKFTQQAVVMEYITELTIDRVASELIEGDLSTERAPTLPLWLSHPLLAAQAPEYLHAIQTRLFLKPVADRLQLHFGQLAAVALHLKSLLARLQTNYPGRLHYGGGNLINLLRHLQIDLTGFDFAGLPIWQADLQGATLHDVNFSGANFAKSLLTRTFGWVSTVAFSPDSHILATGEYSGDICLWGLGTKCLQSKFIGHHNWIWSIEFSPDGRVLASASQDGTVRLWEVATERVIHILQADDYHVLSLSFHPDGQILTTGHGNGLIRSWDVLTGELITTRSAHTKQIFSVKYSPDGRLLATGSDDRTVKIWDSAEMSLQRSLTTHTNKVWSVRFSPDGRLLATGSGDGTIQLWDIATWTIMATLPVYPNWMFSIGFSPDSQMLAVGNSQHQVKIWQVAPTPTTQPPARTKLATLCGHTALVSSIQFSPDGKFLATASSDRSIRLWDSCNWQELHRWQGYTNWVPAVNFALDGTRFVSGTQDGVVRVWDVQTGEIVQTLTGHSQGLLSVEYCPNGRAIASASADGTVKIWATNTGTLLQTISTHQGAVWKIQFSPDGRLLASSGMDNIICLWAETGALVTTLLGHTNLVKSIAFSPDSQRLVTGSFDGYWRLWDIATGQMLRCHLGHHNWLWDLAISPDGQLLATCSADRTAKLWDLATGKLLHTFAGHNLEVMVVKFSPNGRQIATGGVDCLVKIWDVATGNLFQTLTGHLDRVLSLSYSSDGKSIVSGSADETIKLWDLTTGDCVRTCKPLLPYAGMNVTNVTGLTTATLDSLKTLGAMTDSAVNLP